MFLYLDLVYLKLLDHEIQKNILKFLKSPKLKNGGSDIKNQTHSLAQKQTKMNPKTKTKGKGRGELSKEEIRQIEAEEILKYLNKKASKNFDISMEGHLKLIKERLKKYTFEDCIRVIDVKVEQWTGKIFDGVPAENYLTPNTLFKRAKFDLYKNEKLADKSEKQFKNQQEKNLFDFFQKNGCHGNKTG